MYETIELAREKAINKRQKGYLWAIDYYTGWRSNKIKTKYIYALTSEIAIKRSKIKCIDDLRIIEEVA